MVTLSVVGGIAGARVGTARLGVKKAKIRLDVAENSAMLLDS